MKNILEMLEAIKEVRAKLSAKYGEDIYSLSVDALASAELGARVTLINPILGMQVSRLYENMLVKIVSKYSDPKSTTQKLISCTTELKAEAEKFSNNVVNSNEIAENVIKHFMKGASNETH